MEKTIISFMIARRVDKGYNAQESALLLGELITDHKGDNLVSALVYNDFATIRTAEKYVSLTS